MKNTKRIIGMVIMLMIGMIIIRKDLLQTSSHRGGFAPDNNSSGVISLSMGERLEERFQNPNLTKTPTKKLILKNKEINLLVAETPDENMWGLSDFPSLPPDTGMMFVFPQPGTYSFWMKDMRFALDIVWLDADNKIITIHENISPDTYYKNPPELFLPTSPASAVIEVPGGFVEKNNLSVGDRLKIN